MEVDDGDERASRGGGERDEEAWLSRGIAKAEKLGEWIAAAAPRLLFATSFLRLH